MGGGAFMKIFWPFSELSKGSLIAAGSLRNLLVSGKNRNSPIANAERKIGQCSFKYIHVLQGATLDLDTLDIQLRQEIKNPNSVQSFESRLSCRDSLVSARFFGVKIFRASVRFLLHRRVQRRSVFQRGNENIEIVDILRSLSTREHVSFKFLLVMVR